MCCVCTTHTHTCTLACTHTHTHTCVAMPHAENDVSVSMYHDEKPRNEAHRGSIDTMGYIYHYLRTRIGHA